MDTTTLEELKARQRRRVTVRKALDASLGTMQKDVQAETDIDILLEEVERLQDQPAKAYPGAVTVIRNSVSDDGTVSTSYSADPAKIDRAKNLAGFSASVELITIIRNFVQAAEAALTYDAAIQAAGASISAASSEVEYGAGLMLSTPDDSTLDKLYNDWISKSRTALDQYNSNIS